MPNKLGKSKNKNKSSSNKQFKKANCSPIINKNNNKDYSCFDDENLKKMKNAWNSRHPDSKITSNDPYEIWSALKVNMQDVCDIETCWLRQQFISNNVDNELMSYIFAPKSPKSWKNNPKEWLSSDDIGKIMHGWEKEYKDFKFIGPSPIDFDEVEGDECVWEELCNFDLKKLRSKGTKKIGMIFNTDPHYKNGSHWISLFIDISSKNPYIFFFNSTGETIPKQIKVLCDRIIKQGKEEMGIDIEFSENHPVEHQKGNTECGMYSLYLIIQLLTGQNDRPHFTNKNELIKDSTMVNLRMEYFNMAD
jgi:hypothetical protein